VIGRKWQYEKEAYNPWKFPIDIKINNFSVWTVGDLISFETSIFFGRRYEKQGKVQHVDWFSNPKCKFCNAELAANSTFCPKCKRSQT